MHLLIPVLAATLATSVSVASPVQAAVGNLTVLQLAVGQNDAAVFQGPCGEVGIVDAGHGSAGEIQDALAGLGTSTVGWLAASHYDADHIGDVADLTVDIPVVYDRGGGPAAKDTATYGSYYAYAEARAHSAVDIGAVLTLCEGPEQVTFTVLSAGTDGTAADEVAVTEENDRGLCLHVEYGDFDMATCGDVNGSDAGSRTDVESAVADEFGEVEVLKVNHHGSAFSSNATFVSSLSPQVSIISVGDNSFGHPDPAALSRLDAAGDVYQTQDEVDGSAVDGDVTVTTSGAGNFTVLTSSGRAPRDYALDEAPGEPTPNDPGPIAPGVQPAPTRPEGLTRFAGTDRYSTAADVSAGSFPGTADDVFIVTGEDWPDALAAGAAAAEIDGPVLPVTTASIPGPILNELSRLNPVRAWVVGGSSVVNEPVLDDLRARGITVKRVSGGDRYSTAAAVVSQFFVNPPGAYYASGAGYADALGGGAAAAKRGWPLLLTAPDFVPAATPIIGNERIALGGTAAISDAVIAQLQARRVAGGDRFSTAAAIARDAFDRAPTIYLATGLKFPDALAGTVAAARDDAPILLTLTDCVTPATKDASASLGGTSRVILGGTAVVTDQAADLAVCQAPAPPAPPPSQAPPPPPPANPGDNKNCSDFATYREAQDYFDFYYPHYGDVARLDQDNDLIACESLPGAP